MAKREVEYGKVPGADNLSDLFTKALDEATIGRHTTGMHCEFAEGKDDLAYTIHFVGAGPGEGIFNDKIGKALNLRGEYAAWTRTDLRSKTTKTSMRGGPDWSRVKARMTLDADTKKVILVEQIQNITRNKEHVLLSGDGGERNIMTILIYDDKGESDKEKLEKGEKGRCHGYAAGGNQLEYVPRKNPKASDIISSRSFVRLRSNFHLCHSA